LRNCGIIFTGEKISINMLHGGNMINDMDNNKLDEMVSRLREQLYSLVDEYGLNNNKVLEFSKELDELILAFIEKN
jgi:Spo0E like sporulation regulatory protein.